MPAPHALYSKMLAERTASRNVLVLFYFILFIYIWAWEAREESGHVVTVAVHSLVVPGYHA